jgi:hypothetical protein
LLDNLIKKVHKDETTKDTAFASELTSANNKIQQLDTKFDGLASLVDKVHILTYFELFSIALVKLPINLILQIHKDGVARDAAYASALTTANNKIESLSEKVDNLSNFLQKVCFIKLWS